MQDRLGRGDGVPLLSEQPRLEGRRALDGQAFEQVRTQPGQADGIHPGPLEHQLNINHRAVRQLQDHRLRNLYPPAGPRVICGRPRSWMVVVMVSAWSHGPAHETIRDSVPGP